MSEQQIRLSGLKCGQMAVNAHKIESRKPVRRAENCEGMAGSAELAADVEEFLPALLADGGGVHSLQLIESRGDGVTCGGDHGGGVAVGASDRLLEDGIDHTEAEHVLGCDLHAVGGFLGLGTVAPEDRGGG